jgi:biopolymer transport protein ExbD
MRFTQKKRRQPPAVIIIALIDVLIVILIFLMVTTTFKNQIPALKLALPESSQSKPGDSQEDMVVLTLASQPPYFYLGNEAVTTNAFRSRLQQAVEKNPEVRLSIRGDKTTPWGLIVNIMDMAKEAKVKSVTAVTQAPGANQN